MRQHFLGIMAVSVLVAAVPPALAHQSSLADIAKSVEEAQAKKAESTRVKDAKAVTNDKANNGDKADEPNKAASSSAVQPVTCATLLQHPLAWWLGSMPTSVERDQLAACLAGSGQRAPAAPSVSPAPSALSQDKPANWNTMDAEQQATWNRLAPKTWAQMTEQEHKDWYRILAPKETVAPTMPLLSPVSVARWTPGTCDSERQSLSLLSERINQTVAQLQAVAAQPPPGSTAKASPPTYRCDSDSLGSQTTTTCRPYAGYVSPGAAFSDALEQSMAKREAEKRWNALAAQAQTQQRQFDTQFQEWKSQCRTR